MGSHGAEDGFPDHVVSNIKCGILVPVQAGERLGIQMCVCHGVMASEVVDNALVGPAE